MRKELTTSYNFEFNISHFSMASAMLFDNYKLQNKLKISMTTF